MLMLLLQRVVELADLPSLPAAELAVPAPLRLIEHPPGHHGNGDGGCDNDERRPWTDNEQDQPDDDACDTQLHMRCHADSVHSSGPGAPRPAQLLLAYRAPGYRLDLRGSGSPVRGTLRAGMTLGEAP